LPSRIGETRRNSTYVFQPCALFRLLLSPWLYKPLHGKTSALGANRTEHGLCPVRPLHRPNHAGVFGHPGVGYLAPEAACCTRIKGIEHSADTLLVRFELSRQGVGYA